MSRVGSPRRPIAARTSRRRTRFHLEFLETRWVLSALGPGTTVTPAVHIIGPASLSGSVTNSAPRPGSFAPGQISVAYAFYLRPENGSGTTIAIVDSYHNPNIREDLAIFDAYYHLPSADLTIQNQYGQTDHLPATDAGWSLEIATDVEWAHAIAPSAKILLIEANSANTNDIAVAVQTAARQANVVSMSWGGGEFPGQVKFDGPAYFGNPNVAFVAATGDDGGALGAEWPAVSPNVIGVGGTSLYLNAGAYGNETAWNGTRSRGTGASGSTGGVSVLEPLPYFQSSVLGPISPGRLTPDVAVVGNPDTGLAVYNSVPGAGSTGWIKVGGTSVGAPIWAGLIARADQARSGNHLGPLSSAAVLNLLYGSYTTKYGAFFHDTTAGSNFAGTAKPGYDLVTGLGSPIANNIIAAAATFDGAAPTPIATPAATRPRRIRHPIARRHRHDIVDVENISPHLDPSTVVVVGLPSLSVTLGPASAAPNSAGNVPTQLSSTLKQSVSSSSSSLPRPVQPLGHLHSGEPIQLKAQNLVVKHSPGSDLYLGHPITSNAHGDLPEHAPSRTTSGLELHSALSALSIREGVPQESVFPFAAVSVVASTDSMAGMSSAGAALLAIALWGIGEHESHQARMNRRQGKVTLEALVHQG